LVEISFLILLAVVWLCWPIRWLFGVRDDTYSWCSNRYGSVQRIL